MNKIESREAWIKLLLSNNTKYLITLTPSCDLSKHAYQKTVNAFIRRLRKIYFHKNKIRDSFSGYVITETQYFGRYHAHILLSDHKILYERNFNFNNTVYKIVKNLKYINHNINQSIDIKEYTPGNLESYVTKSIRWSKNFDFIAPINYYGCDWN